MGEQESVRGAMSGKGRVREGRAWHLLSHLVCCCGVELTDIQKDIYKNRGFPSCCSAVSWCSELCIHREAERQGS